MGMEVRPSGQALGAAVFGVDLSKPMGDGLVADIRAAWLEHQVIAFPDQKLALEDLERVSQAFGPFGEDPFIAPIAGHPHVICVKREADEQTPIFAEVWHSDWSFRPTPPAGTMLYGVEIPSVGGDTLFADQYAAYETLSEAMKARIAPLRGVHSAARGYSREGLYGERDKGRSMDIRPSDEAKKTQTHPLVRTHSETGRKALFANMGYVQAIDDLPPDEGWALLLDLFRHQTQDAFVYRHKWAPGMLTLWDNRCVVHKATGGYEGHRRVLWRTTVDERPAL
ncbi:MAG: TauD/TfdA family dioxygenase [Hydrogenophilaceae bacterium]|nr:TauD/TfdA family dioxygenase [Hydrogenophilaceae bacterium]